jgi:primosomal protein N'
MISQNILEQIIGQENRFKNLSKKYKNIDITSFSEKWSLYDFQKKAIKNAMGVLDFYFNRLNRDKSKLFDFYKQYGLNKKIIEEKLNIKNNNEHIELLSNHFNVTDGRIKGKEFINRMSFWMATGSGKTLVMIKLIEILAKLINKGLIPKRDILILAPTDDILEQIHEHIDKFNSQGNMKIITN